MTRIVFCLLVALGARLLFALMPPAALQALKLSAPLLWNACHVPAYAALALLFLLLFCEDRSNLAAQWWPYVLSFVATMWYGLFDELNQMYSPFRDASGTDLILDAIGAVTTLLAVRLFATARASSARFAGAIR